MKQKISKDLRAFKVFAIKNGTVIDHIKAGQALKIIQILKLYANDKIVSVGLNFPSKTLKFKDIINESIDTIKLNNTDFINSFSS